MALEELILSRRPARSRILWLLLAVVLLVTAGFALSISYRNRNRLTQEKLDAARERWRAAGIESYAIDVTVSGVTSGQYHVVVRNGKITEAKINDQPFDDLAKARPWTVPELFNILQLDLDNESKPGTPGAYTQVEFDAEAGYLVHYLRHQHGGRQRVEIRVVLTR